MRVRDEVAPGRQFQRTPSRTDREEPHCYITFTYRTGLVLHGSLPTAVSTCFGTLVFYSASLSDAIAPHADGRLAKAAMRPASEGTAIG